jgi:hypothetical protein
VRATGNRAPGRAPTNVRRVLEAMWARAAIGRAVAAGTPAAGLRWTIRQCARNDFSIRPIARWRASTAVVVRACDEARGARVLEKAPTAVMLRGEQGRLRRLALAADR